MLQSKLKTAVVLTFLLAMLPTSQWCGALTPDEALQRLKQKDHALDNSSIVYETSGVRHLQSRYNSYLWKEKGATITPEDRLPREIPFTHEEHFIVRGNQITRILNSSKQPAKPQRYVHRFSNMDGAFTELVDMGGQVDLTIKPESPSIMNDSLAMTELLNGYGFGKRIKEITSERTAGKGVVLEGSIGLPTWDDKACKLTLELDESFIPRKVLIETSAVRIELTTEGIVHQMQFDFPATAVLSGTSVNGRYYAGPFHVLGNTPRITSKFISVETNLSDERYQSLTAAPLAPGTPVRDDRNGAHFDVDGAGSSIKALIAQVR